METEIKKITLKIHFEKGEDISILGNLVNQS